MAKSLGLCANWVNSSQSEQSERTRRKFTSEAFEAFSGGRPQRVYRAVVARACRARIAFRAARARSSQQNWLHSGYTSGAEILVGRQRLGGDEKCAPPTATRRRTSAIDMTDMTDMEESV